MKYRSLLLLLLVAAPALPDAKKPTKKDVERAMDMLSVDDRDSSKKAIDTLRRDGSHKSLQAIAAFGARTRYTKSTILAGKALASVSEATAAKYVSKTLRLYKKIPAYQMRVAMMAEQIPGRIGTELLVKLAKDVRPGVAATAVRGLGARKEESARTTLLALVKSSRPIVAGAAAFALSRLKPDKPTMELLFLRAQKSVKARVGDACGLALTRMEGAKPYGNRALALLIGRSSSDSFHALVKVAMRLATEPDVDLLKKALASPSDRVREVACDIVGLRKVDGFQKTLYRLATSEHNWRNSVAAWLSLRRVGIGEVVEGIKSSIGKPGEPAYWAIQCAMREIKPKLLPALRTAALGTKDPVKRELAQRALRRATQHRRETRDHYLEAWKKGRGTNRGAIALIGIGNLRDQDSFRTLVKLLEAERDRKYDLQILKGLEKLTGHYFRPDTFIWNEWYKAVHGQVSFTPKPIDRKKNRARIKDIKKLGISANTEAAVERGLLWLSRHQNLNGGWNGSTYHDNCIAGECAKEGGIRERDVAYTALSLLAFQGAGYSHRDGPYRDVMQRGFEFILANMDYDGSHKEKSWTFSYEAAILCQALCDGYALTGDPWLGQGAQRMIDYLVKIQHPGHTWRYRVRSESTDTSVMSWILTACIAARAAGIDMPEQIYVASEAWLDIACDPIPADTFEVFVPDSYKAKNTYFVDISRDEKGKVRTYKIKTWYQPPRLYTPAMSAIGVLCRIWLGWTRAHPFCIGGANQVISKIPGYNDGLEREFAFYPYTWYYGSLAMYQMGGRYWTQWRDKCIRDLIRNQQLAGCQFGSWPMPRGQFVAGLTGGTVYCTAMSILTLETFYRYQPYLARFELRSREGKDMDGKTDSDKPDPEPKPGK